MKRATLAVIDSLYLPKEKRMPLTRKTARSVQILAFFSIAALAAVGVNPANAEEPAAVVEDIILGGADGATLSETLDAAVAQYGQSDVSEVLGALAASADTGIDVNFPGLEDGSLAQVADDLEAMKASVETGVPLPVELGDTEISPIDPGHVVDPSGLGVDEIFQLVSFTKPAAVDVLPMVSAPVGTTPSHYISFGGAIANNRAWQWTAGFNVYRCNTSCTLVDRREIRTTITPYQYRVRVEQTTLYSPNANGIKVPQVTGKVYLPSSPAQGVRTINVPGTITWYIDTPNLWVQGRTMIIGIEQRADTTTGEQSGLYRTLTATCFPAPKSYCAWWV